MALIDRIKFDAPSDDWLVWKYQTNEANRDEQIRIGAQLVVNQTQEALLVKGGQALDLFGPGTHTLTTGNIPLLRKLINLPFGGQTPFPAEVWYINKHAKRNLRWGTKTPIPLIDPVYNYPVSVRAYGQWGIRVEDSRRLMTQLVGTLRDLRSDRIDDYFTGEILQRLSDALSKYFVEKGVSIFQANAKLNELSQFAADAILAEFKRFGLEIVNFNVESVNIPEEEKKKFQEVLGKRMEIEQVSKAQVGQAYTTARTFDVLEKAASTEGGTAGNILAGGLGVGLGLGAGVPVGQQVGQAMNPQPVKPAAEDPMAKLQKLKQMLDAGLITQDEFNAKKKQILDAM
jgi:membrane protease subunit (stomatin/prohibitin family)